MNTGLLNMNGTTAYPIAKCDNCGETTRLCYDRMICPACFLAEMDHAAAHGLLDDEYDPLTGETLAEYTAHQPSYDEKGTMG